MDIIILLQLSTHTLISTFCVPHCVRMYVTRATEYSTKADLNGCCVYFLLWLMDEGDLTEKYIFLRPDIYSKF